MLCSSCSQPIKPVAAIDIDGTLGDYHSHFIYFAEKWLGRPWSGPGYRGSGKMREWFKDAFKATDQEWHEIKLAYRQGGNKRTMPIIDGAQELCWAIKAEGAELWLTTTRPYLSLDNIVPDTVEWCRRNGIGYDGMLFDALKYQEFAKRIDRSRVVVVLDDVDEMLEAAMLLFPREIPIMVDSPYNQAMYWPQKASLAESKDIIIKRIRDWREQYHD